MEYEDRRWRLVAYLSRLLNKIEHNYEIYDKEMLAMIKGLENQIKEYKVSVWGLNWLQKLEILHEGTKAKPIISKISTLSI